MSKNVKIIIDQNNYKSKKIKFLIKNKIKNLKVSNLNIIIGGDGFMLETLKKNISNDKLFYGINSGSYGFLMNKFSPKNFISNISNAKKISISPLIMRVKKKSGIFKNFYAINEVSILRQSKQTANLSISNKSRSIIKKLVSDGLIISTPAGSTAYNMSVYGPILDLDSKKLSLVPISPFRPRRWKGKILSNRSIINVKNLNPSKRPISAVADNIEVRHASEVKIKTDHNIKFNLLYDRDKSLQKKIKIEKVKREIN